MINLPPYQSSTPEQEAWKGMTLEEMQMQRALVQARMEIQKYRINAYANGIKESTPLLSGGKNSMLSRIAGAFTFVEYVSFAVKLIRMISPIFRKNK